jgi:hypothetical protein
MDGLFSRGMRLWAGCRREFVGKAGVAIENKRVLGSFGKTELPGACDVPPIFVSTEARVTGHRRLRPSNQRPSSFIVVRSTVAEVVENGIGFVRGLSR